MGKKSNSPKSLSKDNKAVEPKTSVASQSPAETPLPVAEPEIPVVNARDAYNTDKADINAKFDKYKLEDPFPSIPSVLLNTEDIHNYAINTGMIAPYYPSLLKYVTYGIRLKGGAFLYWDVNEDKETNIQEGRFDDNSEFIKVNAAQERVFVFKRNSIMYVSLESEFRLPFYITARFNLRISYIHQGILLGTGPVIDPGFVGNICIPLHNLTNNDCEIEIDKPIIQVEFTKLNPHNDWLPDNKKIDQTTKDGLPWVNRSIEKKSIEAPGSLSNYLSKAKPHNQIYSSIAGLAHKTEKTIKRADNAISKAEGLNKAFFWAIVVSIAAIAISLGGFAYKSFKFDNNNVEIKTLQRQIDALNTKIDSLNVTLFDFKKVSHQEKTNNTLEPKQVPVK